MIEAFVVTSDAEVGEGLQRLLESDGDIRVVATLPSVRDLTTAIASHADAAVVIGPGAAPSNDEWSRILPTNGHARAVLLAAVPGRHRRPRGVVEVPMELSGRVLRRAVRSCVEA